MATGTRNAQELLGDKKCDLCDTYKDVIWHCQSCQETLCDQCKRSHLRSRFARNHTVTELANITEENQRSSIVCPKHENELFQMYCTTCKTLVCLDCIKHDHNKHDYEKIEDVVKQSKKQLEEAFGHIKSKKIPKLEKLIASITEKQDNYSQEIEKLVPEITNKGELLKREIDKIIDKLRDDLMQQTMKDKQLLQEKKKHIELELAKLKNQTGEQEQSVQNFSDIELILNASTIIYKLLQLARFGASIPRVKYPRFQNDLVHRDHLMKIIGELIPGRVHFDKRRTVWHWESN